MLENKNPFLLKFFEKSLRFSPNQNMCVSCNEWEVPVSYVREMKWDGCWIDAYDPETIYQSSEYRAQVAPTPKKPYQSSSDIKVTSTVFFDCSGVLHYEFLLPGQTVNKADYIEDLGFKKEEEIKLVLLFWHNACVYVYITSVFMLAFVDTHLNLRYTS